MQIHKQKRRTLGLKTMDQKVFIRLSKGLKKTLKIERNQRYLARISVLMNNEVSLTLSAKGELKNACKLLCT